MICLIYISRFILIQVWPINKWFSMWLDIFAMKIKNEESSILYWLYAIYLFMILFIMQILTSSLKMTQLPRLEDYLIRNIVL